MHQGYSIQKQLWIAAEAGDIATIESSLGQGAKVDEPTPKGSLTPGITALHTAVINQKFDAVALLLKHKADPNKPDLDGFIALHFAAENGNTDIVSLLLRSGANPSLANISQQTPLQLAASDAVRVLLCDAMSAMTSAYAFKGAGAMPIAANKETLSLP
jgi:ankyrin